MILRINGFVFPCEVNSGHIDKVHYSEKHDDAACFIADAAYHLCNGADLFPAVYHQRYVSHIDEIISGKKDPVHRPGDLLINQL
jgi:hypothetical protein